MPYDFVDPGFFLTLGIDEVSCVEAKAHTVSQHLVDIRVGIVGEFCALYLASMTAMGLSPPCHNRSGRSATFESASRYFPVAWDFAALCQSCP